MTTEEFFTLPDGITKFKLPTKATLKKYGLSSGEWIDLFSKKYGCCHICGRPFEPGKRVNVDHEHARGWKQMPPERRKQYVRGLLCYVCNKFVTMRGVSSMRLYHAYQYMHNWELRITTDKLVQQEKLFGSDDSVGEDVRESGSNEPTYSTHSQANHQPKKTKRR